MSKKVVQYNRKEVSLQSSSDSEDPLQLRRSRDSEDAPASKVSLSLLQEYI